MNRNRYTQIGLDRLVRLDWLEKTSKLALAGNALKDAKVILQHDLSEHFISDNTNVRGSIDKTITILLKVWMIPSPLLRPLCADGLEILKLFPKQDRLAVHWGMIMAAYPFWSVVAIQVGRLLRLQGTIVSSQVQRRVREQYGERETVSRRVRYVLRSYLDWGVLKETGTKGIYSAGATLPVDDSRIIVWLAEAFLHTRDNGSAPLKDLVDSPSFFPFRIKFIQPERIMAYSSRIEIMRYGHDEHFIRLRSLHS